MEDHRTIVLGLCGARLIAEWVVDGLLKDGVMNNTISVLMVDGQRLPQGTFDLLAGITALGFRGVGRTIAAGPIVQTLQKLDTGASDGLIDALTAMGVAQREAVHYYAGLKNGRALVGVHCDSGRPVSQLIRRLEADGLTDIFVRAGGHPRSRTAPQRKRAMTREL